MGPELQRKLIPLFHYSLNPNGYLFLGTSEGIGEFDQLFAVLDGKAKLYRRSEGPQGLQHTTFGRFLPSMKAKSISSLRNIATPDRGGQTSLRELTEHTLLSQVIAAGALVNANGDILYLHGRTGMFLELASGEARVNNILTMARQGLSRELTTGLRKAVGTKDTVVAAGLRVKTNGPFTTVNLTIRPVMSGSGATADAPLFLVILEEVTASPQTSTGQPLDAAAAVLLESEEPGTSAGDVDARIGALKLELRAKEESLQSTFEELGSSTEELKSASEEMQSVNEELQSTNEELETSKEELQSLNEELATVNTELQTEVADLSRVNNDMNNLLSGTGIGTVFVDHQLRILRFTPTVCSIINLIHTDVGRPVTHIVSNLVDYRSLVTDVQTVLDTLVSNEVPVQTLDGRHFIMRLQPYRTLENVIEGAVISFVDITEMVKTRETLENAHDLLRLAVVVRDARDAITVQDMADRILAWNPGAMRMFEWNEAEALQMNVRDRIPEKLREGALTTLAQLSREEILEPYRNQRITKSGAIVEVSIVSTERAIEGGTK
jgi:two-component system CheB/CheR fusion protein